MNFIRRLLRRDAGEPISRAGHVTRRSKRFGVPQPEPEPNAPAGMPVAADEQFVFREADTAASVDNQPAASEPPTVTAASPAATAPPATAVSVVTAPPKKAPRPQTQPKPMMTRQRQSLTYGIASDTGLARHNNEDACFGLQWHSITVADRPDFGFFIVADGMGGHLDGERAAGVAVQTLAAEMLARIYVPMLRDFRAADSPTILEALGDAAAAANRAVMAQVPGGGTTLTAVATIGNLAYIAHVGDSRAYVIHDDGIEQLTTDHTLVQRLIEMQELSPRDAANYPQKNVLYRAIGQNENVKVERLIRILPPAAQLLLCTDGLWDSVEDELLREVARAAPSPQEACDALVKLANRHGGSDNISVVLLRVPGDDSTR